MIKTVQEKQGNYDEKTDVDLHKNDMIESRDEARHKIFKMLDSGILS